MLLAFAPKKVKKKSKKKVKKSQSALIFLCRVWQRATKTKKNCFQKNRQSALYLPFAHVQLSTFSRKLFTNCLLSSSSSSSNVSCSKVSCKKHSVLTCKRVIKMKTVMSWLRSANETEINFRLCFVFLLR